MKSFITSGPDPGGYKVFLSSQLSIQFVQPITVGILTFINMINDRLL